VAWIHGDQSKTGRPIGVPLNDEAIAVLRKQLGGHPTYCFTYRGKKVFQVNTKAWQGALRKAGIENFRWHDLRHTWASWHVQNGTPIHVLQELGGWSEIKMVQRYAHLAPEHLSPFANNICAGNAGGTFFTTQQKGTKKAALHLVK
jgi:integrase